MANAIQGAKEKEDAKLAGTYGACNECKTTADVRRCTGGKDTVGPHRINFFGSIKTLYELISYIILLFRVFAS